MSNQDTTKVISIYRFDSEKDKKPYIQDFEVDTTVFPGAMLLNALEEIKEKQDSTVSFRRSCGEGVCGSDGMNINGMNGLACKTKLVDLPRRILVQPLPGFPVIKDLIVDMDEFFEQYKSAKPFLQNSSEAPTQERLQSPEDRKKLDGLYECILCACCSSSCPSYWWNPDKFLGPATLIASYRFVADSRDDQTMERLDDLKDPYSMYRCRSIMNCVTVCPKGLNPTEAISKLRLEMISSTHDENKSE